MGFKLDLTSFKLGWFNWVHVVTDQTWSVPLSQVETKYTYDGDGGRVLRISPSLRGTEGDEAISTTYIGSAYEMEGPIGQLPDKVTKQIFMGSTRICSIETATSGGHIYYYHQDHIGSSNVITDETGAVANILEYTPFGEVSRSTGNYSTDKRFTGKIWDEASALLYFGARYYDPELGRFITADPTIQHPFDPQDLNRYSYCRNNPVNYIDPTGYGWNFWNWLASFFAGVVGAVVTIATGGNFVLGAACAGAVYGGITGAMNGGGFEGALRGAAIGFLMGGALAIGGSLPGIGPLIIGGAVAYGGAQAYKADGWRGVADYAITLGASAAGFYAGSAMSYGTTNIGLNGQPRSPPQSESIAARASASLAADNSPEVTPNAKEGQGFPFKGYRALPKDVADNIITAGDDLTPANRAAGRVGNDGVYLADSKDLALAEFAAHNEGMNAAVYEVYGIAKNPVFIDPSPSSESFGALPFTQGYDAVIFKSVRGSGANMLYRGGYTWRRIQ